MIRRLVLAVFDFLVFEFTAPGSRGIRERVIDRRMRKYERDNP